MASGDFRLDGRTAIVGVGATPFYRRGESLPQTPNELVTKAILAAADDAGMSPSEIDGFALYNGGYETGFLAQHLGVKEMRFSCMLTGGGGGVAGTLGLAAMAVATGQATAVVCAIAVQQGVRRLGSGLAVGVGGASVGSPESDFLLPSGVVGPGILFAMIAQRHMHLYGTTREAFAEVAINSRNNAVTQPDARYRTALTADEYFAARMIAEPLCLYDFCMENDAAMAVIVTSAERARDLRRRPVYVMGSVQGGRSDWGPILRTATVRDPELFATSGHQSIAERLYGETGSGPDDVDVALVYDHFSPAVILQLEDYGFCARGEGGPFVLSGAIRRQGSIPVNPHGGQLSQVYTLGMNHIREAVYQLRGEAANQISGAEIALVTGGPANIPTSGTLLRS